MASNARCLFLLLLALSFSLQTHAREIKFFSKVTKNIKETISLSPVQAPTLAPSPSPEPEVVEHGFGLYGQDPYEKYEYPPTTTNPTKTPQFDEELSKQSNSETYFNGNGYVSETQGMSDTRFLENGKYFYDVSQDKSSFLNKDENRGNGYSNQEKQGMSDTRFLENGEYFYDVNNEETEENAHFNTNNNENENKNFEAEKQGMSDTRFLENGKYFYDVNNEEKEANKEGNFGEFDVNNGENENGNGNGKYFHDVYNDKENNNYNSNNNHEDNDNLEYGTRYNGNGNSEYETQGRGAYNYNHNEYHAKEGREGYNYPKKFPKYEYDTMEEYDREQGYIDGKDHYVP